ncbi:glutathione S-transferase family protein [Parvularcula marina]|uniref:Glutathione S-transferase family protein n=1 Tax=Parvularcula marina TaxID=2292771 RepID=A0A371RGI1_9PROT|nr:glutathione S-transferase family protein [Parvularcula marina]RFB04573.1 glutathione S-transferase family protein [Parvularcula marina]
MSYTLVIGNKALSSWSLRPWLLMKAFDIPFTEANVRFRQKDTREQILAHSPAGLVPVLKDGDLTIWDSLAIAEYLAEQHPENALWPEDRVARAHARTITAEMHAGFSNLRTIWPMDAITKDAGVLVPQAVQNDLNRIFDLWDETIDKFGGEGPYLFGEFTIADAFYAPVMYRIRPFGPLNMPQSSETYYKAMLDHPAMKEWEEGAEAEYEAGWYS